MLGRPDAARAIGRAAVALKVATGVRVAVRALGSPGLVFTHADRATAKFTLSHGMEVLEIGLTHARLRYSDLSGGRRYHRLDCDYSVGLVEAMPTLFGLPAGQVRHTRCGARGADACVYEVAWVGGAARASRLGTALGAATVAATALSSLVAPRLLATLAVPLVAAGLRGRGRAGTLRRRLRSLELQLDDEREMSRRISASLQDLASELRPDEVLPKVVTSAQAALVGKEFLLLLQEGEVLRCAARSGVSVHVVARLERFAAASPGRLGRPLEIGDLQTVPELESIPRDPDTPLRSLAAAPLRFAGEPIGLLVALAHSVEAFFPADVSVLASYADQAAIALANAQMVKRLEMLASEDPLTGLLNHREFHAALIRETARAERHGEPVSLLLLDLDGFKRVNDERGHPEGDGVLQQVARLIAGASRVSDAACRVGGDEFALVLPRSRRAEAVAVAQRIQAAVQALEDGVGVSFGVAEDPGDGATAEALLAHADRALYRAKRLRAAGSAGVERAGRAAAA